MIASFSFGYKGIYEKELFDGVHVIFAEYRYEDYQGYAFVLFEKDGKLFEVNGVHCSCNSLGGQWDLEETTLDAIRYRVLKGKHGYSERLREILSI